MSANAITVKNLSKRYLVGHRSLQRERDNTLRDVITREVRTFAQKAMDLVHGRQIVQGDEIEEFWALKDVSFEVKQGEALGIIGRNGAGKSTLLKILSRITEPTEGRVTIRGRVASLLEIGTGFHAELTGRENIYLNGALLGMTRQEIRKKFDEIIAFAEIDKFLDTPVKRYSSGMYVRLAFAVAAHVEPEILIVDEVLAVGDVQFQKKCLGKMREVGGRDGRTVFFVSHNMAAIEALCSRVMMIEGGTIALEGTAREVVFAYLSAQTTRHDVSCDHVASDDDISKIVLNGGATKCVLGVGDTLTVTIHFRRAIEFPRGILAIYNAHNELVVDCDGSSIAASDTLTSVSKQLTCQIQTLCLVPGEYYFNLAILSDGKMIIHRVVAGRFVIVPGEYMQRIVTDAVRGLLVAQHFWSS
jgi:ABC-type polysaccharide/polyol phosphate transport system ATPase subunit